MPWGRSPIENSHHSASQRSDISVEHQTHVRALLPQMVDGGLWRGAEQEVGVDKEVER